MTPRRQELPLVRWNGTTPVALIADLEARLAAGTRFAVLSAASHLGHGPDRTLLARWWSTREDQLADLCAGWAVVVPRADVDSALLDRRGAWDVGLPFPVRACADQADAFRWLHSRLEQAGAAPSPAAVGTPR